MRKIKWLNFMLKEIVKGNRGPEEVNGICSKRYSFSDDTLSGEEIEGVGCWFKNEGKKIDKDAELLACRTGLQTWSKRLEKKGVLVILVDGTYRVDFNKWEELKKKWRDKKEKKKCVTQ